LTWKTSLREYHFGTTIPNQERQGDGQQI